MSKPHSERKLYKIGFVTETLGVTSRTIRFYDQFGLLPSVKRSHGNTRLFSEEDLSLLRKIIHLQQKEFLPLLEIKKRLFGDTAVQKAWVVTDSTAVLPSGFDRITQVKADTPEAFEKCYLALSEQGVTHVFSLHTSASACPAYKAAKTAASKVAKLLKVEVIDTLSAALGVGLLAYRVSHMIGSGDSSETVSLIIGKEVPLLQMMVITEGLGKFVMPVSKPKTIQDQFQTGVAQLCPLMTLNQAQLTINGSYLTLSNALETLLELLEQEFVVRGGYIGTIFIAHHDLFTYATYLVTMCKERFPKSEIVFQEDKTYLSSTFGEKCIAIALM